MLGGNYNSWWDFWLVWIKVVVVVVEKCSGIEFVFKVVFWDVGYKVKGGVKDDCKVLVGVFIIKELLFIVMGRWREE